MSIEEKGARASVTVNGIKFEALAGNINSEWEIKFRNGNPSVKWKGGAKEFVIRASDWDDPDALVELFNATQQQSNRAKATYIDPASWSPGFNWNGINVSFNDGESESDKTVDVESGDTTASGRLEWRGAEGAVAFSGDTDDASITVNSNDSQYTFTGTYGELKLDADGDWTYELKESGEGIPPLLIQRIPSPSMQPMGGNLFRTIL